MGAFSKSGHSPQMGHWPNGVIHHEWGHWPNGVIHEWGHWLLFTSAPCAHQTKKERLQEVHVCVGEAGQQLLLVHGAARAQVTCLCGLTIKTKLSDCYASEVTKMNSLHFTYVGQPDQSIVAPNKKVILRDRRRHEPW